MIGTWNCDALRKYEDGTLAFNVIPLVEGIQNAGACIELFIELCGATTAYGVLPEFALDAPRPQNHISN